MVLLFASAPAAAQEGRIALTPGEVTATIGENSPRVKSMVLGGPSYAGLNRGALYSLTPDAGGPYAFQLESNAFDAYLVLREADGTILAEDDDGFIPQDAQIVAELEAGETYLLDACAIHGGAGEFLLRVVEGRPEPIPAEKRHALALENQRAILSQSIRTHGPYAPRTIAALERLGWMLWWNGHYREVVDLLTPLLAASELLRGREHPDTARILRHLADSKNQLGRFDEAEAMFRRALAIREKALGEDAPETVDSLLALSEFLIGQGRDEEAEGYLQRIRRLMEVDDWDDARIADGIVVLARLMKKRGRLDEAEELYRRALQQTEAAHMLDYAPGALLGLARIRLQQRDLDEARELFERAFEITSQQWRSGHPSLIWILSGLGDVALLLADFDDAQLHYDDAVQLALQVYGNEHASTAIHVSKLAALSYRRGRLEETDAHLTEALEMRVKSIGPDHASTAYTRRELARLRLDLGRSDEAFELAGEAASVARRWLENVFDHCSEQDRFHYAAKHRWVVDTLLSATAAAPTPARERRAYEAVAAWKGMVFRAQARTLRQPSEEGRAILAELRTVRRRMSELLYGDPGHAETDVAARIAELRRRREELDSDLSRLNATGSAQALVGVDEIATSLPDAGAWVEFHIGRRWQPARTVVDRAGERITPGHWLKDQLTAWVVRSDGALARVELGFAQPVQQLVEEFLDDLVTHRALTVVRVGESEESIAAELREALWDPIAAHLDGVDLVLMSPDGFLGTLPFETLTERDGSFLIEKRAFVYMQDGSSLVRASGAVARASPTSILALGNVDYDEMGRADRAGELLAAADASALRSGLQEFWLPLSETGREADGILHMAKRFLGEEIDRQSLQGTEATEARLKSEIEGRDVLHLATHGYFQPEGLPSMWEEAQGGTTTDAGEMRREREELAGLYPGLLSGLVLAGANLEPEESEEDGLLTADELGWLDLSSCQLAVLSACETGLGTARGGEGLQSLRRAFHQAGARTVISSLWRVRDQETVELMTGFYRRHWMDGESPSRALRSSQLEMLRKNRERYRGRARPSTWGAFVLSGDWR